MVLGGIKCSKASDPSPEPPFCKMPVLFLYPHGLSQVKYWGVKYPITPHNVSQSYSRFLFFLLKEQHSYQYLSLFFSTPWFYYPLSSKHIYRFEIASATLHKAATTAANFAILPETRDTTIIFLKVTLTSNPQCIIIIPGLCRKVQKYCL